MKDSKPPAPVPVQMPPSSSTNLPTIGLVKLTDIGCPLNIPLNAGPATVLMGRVAPASLSPPAALPASLATPVVATPLAVPVAAPVAPSDPEPPDPVPAPPVVATVPLAPVAPWLSPDPPPVVSPPVVATVLPAPLGAAVPLALPCDPVLPVLFGVLLEHAPTHSAAAKIKPERDSQNVMSQNITQPEAFPRFRCGRQNAMPMESGQSASDGGPHPGPLFVQDGNRMRQAKLGAHGLEQ
jgi:hypothetical protein